MKNIVGVLALLLVGFACSKSGGENPAPAGFDRVKMLENYYDGLILPAFIGLETNTLALETAIKALNANPSETTLMRAQGAWESAYFAWQSANAYNFGPTGEEGLRKGLVEEIGTFPSNITKIENNINNAVVTFNDFERDNRGFLAIEYLLFDVDTPTALGKLRGNTNRRNYLNALTEHLKGWVSGARSGWAAYRSEFVRKDGTDVGSSTSALYNEFVRSFESIKNFKVGLPMGLRAGQLQPEPNRVEAFYSKKSLLFLSAHLRNIENIYYGKNIQDGLGFKDYLDSLNGGKELVSATETQWRSVQTVLNAVPSNTTLADLARVADAKGVSFHTELQKQTRFFKSDMSSLMGIAITYASGDGD
jgi:uncharacterized protein